MARFQGGEVSGEAPSTLPGRAKAPLQPTLSSSPAVPAKKPVLESLSGSAIKIPPKPTLKNTDAQEPNRSKPLVSKLSNARIGDRPDNVPPKPSIPQPPEAKAPAPKPSASKPPLSTSQSDSKAAFSKPSPPVLNRPSWVKEDTGGGETGSTPLKLQQKPTSSISKLRQQTETATSSKPSLPNSAPKPPSNFKEAQSIFNKEVGAPEQPEGGSKAPPTATNATLPPKPAASKKPSYKKPSPKASSSNGDAAATGPKRNPLVNVFALGPAPAKPNRPPTVNLEPFRRGAEGSSEGESRCRPSRGDANRALTQMGPSARSSCPLDVLLSQYFQRCESSFTAAVWFQRAASCLKPTRSAGASNLAAFQLSSPPQRCSLSRAELPQSSRSGQPASLKPKARSLPLFPRFKFPLQTSFLFPHPSPSPPHS